MKISSIVGKDKLTLSFEVFPPKTDSDFEKVKEATCAGAGFCGASRCGAKIEALIEENK